MINIYTISSFFFFYVAYNILYNHEFKGRGGGYISFELSNTTISFGFFFIFLGVLFLILWYKSYKKNKYNLYKICPKCEDSYNSSDLKDDICPNCDIKTVNLEGYFDKKR